MYLSLFSLKQSYRFEKFNSGEVFLLLPIDAEIARAILNAENASAAAEIFPA